MPEVIEVETYRCLAARALFRPISEVHTPDDWFLKRGTSGAALRASLVGNEFTDAQRIGKLLLLHGPESVLGLRFGMSGRLLVDGTAGIERLLYSSERDEPGWDRFGVGFADGGSLVLRDPRRLGGVELDPDTSMLGVDALKLTLADLRSALASSHAPLKARLMDQSKIAGLGNLLTDEVLWRAGLDPAREAGSLTRAELRRAHNQIGDTVRELSERGGSHTGDLGPERNRGGRCPRDGAELRQCTIGGRTTYMCPRHQR